KQRSRGSGKWIRSFERAGTDVQWGKSFPLSGYSKILDKLRDNAGLVSTLAQFDHKQSLILRDAAATIEGNILLDRKELRDDDVVRYYANDKDARDALNREIRRIDLGVQEMNVVAAPAGPVALFKHEGLHEPMP